MKNWPAKVSTRDHGGFDLNVRSTALALAVSAVSFCADPPNDGSWVRTAPEWQVSFVHVTGAAGEFHLPEIMGGGVALFDADADGDADLYLTNGHHDPATGAADPAGPANAFFRNEGARFVEASAESGLDDRGYGMGVAVGDADNDGDLDVYVANFGPDRFYTNDGGVFLDSTLRSGLGLDGWSSSATFLDYDRDGWLDLFVTRYVDYRPTKRCTDSAGRADYCGPSVFAPQTDRLYRNRGDGTFEDVTDASGIGRGIGRGLGVVAFDVDGDRWVDLYVVNDGDANHLWVQQAGGRFADEALLRGVAYNQAGDAEAGMGVLAEDLDADGATDLFVTHLAAETNTLYRHDGATYRDLTGASGLATESLPFTGFGTAAVDLELDGTQDLIVVNGRVSGGFDRGPSRRRFVEPNQLFLNSGTGRFVPLEWDSAGISRGLATADLDRDGDDDWVVANLEAPPEVWINDSPRRGHWLAVRPRMGEPLRDADGAWVILEVDGRRVVRRIDRGGSYLSSRDAVARFGLAETTDSLRLTILWPDGTEETFAVPGIDRVLEVVRGAGAQP